jgi:hypothetical protein
MEPPEREATEAEATRVVTPVVEAVMAKVAGGGMSDATK